ncbi:sensor histidine kinase [Paenibacillus sp. 453mf]|uniref:sensor histidine kinase n=1 Tax=Paenibacillus sp. 453mf TaxID=1761874 RepID=UPI0008EF7679|nr:sensor histidine kinase [Paenibacillus sp. 453mf]SFS51950.1 two-component system, sensor histidine kinase YesM [Paenibacillus sp. 453mf]
MKPSLNNVRLRDKMLLLYFLAVFLPILATNIIFYTRVTDNVKNQRIQDINLTLTQIKNEFTRELQDTLEISSEFYTDHMLYEIIETSYPHPAQYITAYDSYLRRILHSGSAVYNTVEGITVYSDNPTLLYSGGISLIDDAVKKEPWYEQIMSAEQTQPLIIRHGENNQQGKMSVIRKMDYYYSQNEYTKLLKVDVRMSTIRQILGNRQLQGNVYLLNGSGEIEYTTDPHVNVSKGAVSYADIELPDEYLEFQTPSFMTNHLNSWTIAAAISKDVVLYEVRQSRNFIITLTCLNFLLPTIVLIWISRSMNVRLIRILKHMKRVKNQHYDTINDSETTDEIGQLTYEFNRMTLQLKSLINDVYVADIQKKNLEIERKEAQLNALQSQINPHFLFNTLETIRMRSLMKEEEETSKIIHNLAKILRNSLVWKRDMVTLREEVEFIHCFLEIQRYRFGDRINYEVKIHPEDKDRLIPKMSIVTFVENAALHGIEPVKHGGTIKVNVQVIDDLMYCTIMDNGAGMPTEQVNRINAYMSKDEDMGERIGIQNVIYRMKLYYGANFKFTIESEPGIGTYVSIIIPVDP